MLKFKFNEKKATEVATILLEKNGGKMNYMKLIKLMYLIDREALAEWERPLTGDSYFSLPHGPILSNVLDYINSGVEPGNPTYWHKYISKKNYEIALKSKPVIAELSKREIKLISKIYSKYKTYDQYALRDYCHKHLLEWEDPKGSALPISVKDILIAVKKTEKEIAEIEEEITNLQFVSQVLSC
ncbi:MAG: SocA family protein [Deltaproteobacteria bacterium]|nr:SocA family protein [Deltaproteobacteria bacterium]